MLLTTAKQDSEVYFDCYRSKIFDLYGSDYLCNRGQIGGSEASSSPQRRMLKDLPLKIIVTFQEVPKQVKEIAAMEIPIRVRFSDVVTGYESYKDYNPVFRKILVSN